MSESCAEVLRLGLSNDPNDYRTASRGMREVCDPGLNKVVVEVSRMTNKLLKLSDHAADQTLEITNGAIRDFSIFVLFAVFATTGIAIYFALTGVTRPLKAIVATLEKLSFGELDAKIPALNARMKSA